MIAISKSQLRLMAESTVGAYLDRVTARIRADFPVELGALPSDNLRIRVQVAFERFRAQGFQRKEHLHRLIVLEILFGPQFEAKLPTEARLFAFPPQGVPSPAESERFWAIYRAAHHLKLRHANVLSGTPSASVLTKGDAWN